MAIYYHFSKFTLLYVICGQGMYGENGLRGFPGDDGEPVWETS